jgi:hypothetical protein
MKTFVTILTASIFFIGLSIGDELAFAKKDGAPSGSTGSPGDGGSCAKVGCHTGSATVSFDKISTNIPDEGYLSDETYTITLSLESTLGNRFGFQMSPQNDLGDLQGAMILTDDSRTKFVGGSKYVTHNLSSIDGVDGEIEWSFDWTPLETNGDVTFYAAYNIGNGNSTASGDSIYITSLTIPENPANNPVSIEEYLQNKNLVLGNPVSNVLVYQSTASWTGNTINIYSLNGSLIKSGIITEAEYGSMDVTDLISGIYLLQIQGTNVTERFIKL